MSNVWRVHDVGWIIKRDIQMHELRHRFTAVCKWQDSISTTHNKKIRVWSCGEGLGGWPNVSLRVLYQDQNHANVLDVTRKVLTNQRREITNPTIDRAENSSWHHPKKSYIRCMKEKIITINPKGITQKQYSNFLLELNLMKQAWKPYGVNMEIKAPGLKNIIKWGTTVHNGTDTSKRRTL